MAFNTAVTDLQKGTTEPLHTEAAQQELRRRRDYVNMEAAWAYNAPIGHRILEGCVRGGRGMSLRANRMLVLVLTFLCYAAYHASRKPPSIVKSVLNGDGSAAHSALGGHRRSALEVMGRALLDDANKHKHKNSSGDSGDGWAPFNNRKVGKSLLGDLDLAFLGSYARKYKARKHMFSRQRTFWPGIAPRAN